MGRPRKYPKFDPDQVLEPIQPCFLELDGAVYSFNPGYSRLRGDHPAVQAHPGLFKPVDPRSQKNDDDRSVPAA